MLSREEELSQLSPAQVYVWRVAQAHYDATSRLDYDRLSPAGARLEADRNRDALGDVLRVLGEILQNPDAHGRKE